MSEAAFDRVIGSTLAFEGGYANDPADPGGETNFGISKRAYPDLDIKALTRDQAIAIYRKDYWPPWADMPDPIAAKMFDLGVNMGIGGATGVLQRALVELGQRVDVDDKIGPETKASVAEADVAELLPEIVREAEDHYRAIVKHRPESEKFLKGWLRRAAFIPIPAEEKHMDPTTAPAAGVNLAHVGATGIGATSATAMLAIVLGYQFHMPAEAASAYAGLMVLVLGSLSGVGAALVRKFSR